MNTSPRETENEDVENPEEEMKLKPSLEFFEKLCKRSEQFEEKTEFPSVENRIKNIGVNNKKKAEIAEHAQRTTILLHEDVRSLIQDFMDFKREQGTAKEKKLYSNLKTVEDFVKRAIEKRPLCFFGSNDITILRNNETPSSKLWELVGTDDEKDIEIEQYMTYDEIAISALIGVVVPTFFINSGGRYNSARPEMDKEDFGIYIALTGARFEKRDKMESMHILVSEQYHQEKDGYGVNADLSKPRTRLLNIWAKFYGQHFKDSAGNERPGFPSFSEIDDLYKKSDPKIKEEFSLNPTKNNSPPVYFNIPVYKKRLHLILEPFLREADNRAKEHNKQAYIHAVGLGLGVWQISSDQPTWMLEVYSDIIINSPLNHIDVIDFSWFPDGSVLPKTEDGYIFTQTKHKIKILFSRRDPAEQLNDPNYLLVAMYAWDGNSFPGNEYWRGMLHASGDPAAACCSTIAELQNPYINEEFVERITWVAKL